MAPTKPNFFKRLFGVETPVAPPSPPETQPQEPFGAPPEPVVPTPPSPEPAVGQPAPEDVPPPGPPETQPAAISVATSVAPVVPVSEPPPLGWFARLSTGLRRSSDQLTGSIANVFTKKKLDAATLDELEEVLIQADLGVDTAM